VLTGPAISDIASALDRTATLEKFGSCAAARGSSLTLGTQRTFSMRRVSGITLARALKQTSAEPLACSVRLAKVRHAFRGFRSSDRAAARTSRCQQRSVRMQRHALVRQSNLKGLRPVRSLLPRSVNVFWSDSVFRAVAPSLHFQHGIAQQGARANAVTCHGSCFACSAPSPVVAHL